jgi:hypothetical protein
VFREVGLWGWEAGGHHFEAGARSVGEIRTCPYFPFLGTGLASERFLRQLPSCEPWALCRRGEPTFQLGGLLP